MKTQTCDVLVIGAGPAGSSAANAAAEEGADVVVAEKRARVGIPVRCAEYIAKGLLGEIRLPAESVCQAVSGMHTYLPDGSLQEYHAPGFTVHRDLFDQALAETARESGARLLLNTRALAYDAGDVVCAQKDENIRIRARVIVGADGPHSIVGRWMKRPHQNMVPALQMRVKLSRPLQVTEVYFRPELYGGYGWLFPKQDMANVGIGMKHLKGRPRNFHSYLKQFADHLRSNDKIKGTPMAFQAGWIPVEPVSNPVKDQFLLVGDAAGHVHSITGAGIPYAVLGGKMAGRWAARAAMKNDMGLLMNYSEEFDEDVADTLARACERRTFLEEKWDSLNEVIKETWITYRAYYTRRGGRKA